MKLESTLDRRPGLLHLVPLLDVMALMVIFYLLGTTFIHQSGVAVKLPVSSSQIPPLASAHVVLVAGDPTTPQIFFDRRQLGLAELQTRLMQGPKDGGPTTVILKADRRIPSGTLIDITNAAQVAGFQVMLATELNSSDS